MEAACGPCSSTIRRAVCLISRTLAARTRSRRPSIEASPVTCAASLRWLPGIGAVTEHLRQDCGAGAGARSGPGQNFDVTGAEGLAASVAADGGSDVVPAGAVPEHQ